MTYREVLRVLIINNLSKKEIKYLNQKLIDMYKNVNGFFPGRDEDPVMFESNYVELEKIVQNMWVCRYRKNNPVMGERNAECSYIVNGPKFEKNSKFGA